MFIPLISGMPGPVVPVPVPVVVGNGGAFGVPTVGVVPVMGGVPGMGTVPPVGVIPGVGVVPALGGVPGTVPAPGGLFAPGLVVAPDPVVPDGLGAGLFTPGPHAIVLCLCVMNDRAGRLIVDRP